MKDRHRSVGVAASGLVLALSAPRASGNVSLTIYDTSTRFPANASMAGSKR